MASRRRKPRNRWIEGGSYRSAMRGFCGACGAGGSWDAAFEFAAREPPVPLGYSVFGELPHSGMIYAGALLRGAGFRLTRAMSRDSERRAGPAQRSTG